SSVQSTSRLKSIAAVRAHTIHAITKSRTLNEGQPFAATTSAPRAKGNAKIVCEKRISCRNRAIPSLRMLLIVGRKLLQKLPKKTRFSEYCCDNNAKEGRLPSRPLHRFWKPPPVVTAAQAQGLFETICGASAFVWTCVLTFRICDSCSFTVAVR